ncbi:MAG: class I SAM-dependent methyltransferase [Fidelibacterota bacterium]
MSLVSNLFKNKIFRWFIYFFEDVRSKSRLRQIIEFLDHDQGRCSIVDIGCGTGLVTEKLHDYAQSVVGFDVVNNNLSHKIKFTLGSPDKPLPFKNKEFDYTLLIFVLHHSNDPIFLLKEVNRISNHVVIFEDIIINPVQKYYTLLVDSVLNLEFKNHPHRNKNDAEWKNTFADIGYHLIDQNYSYNFLGLRHARYFLKSTSL